jgi:glutamine amidotransferase
LRRYPEINMKKIGIIDYGLGNIFSVEQALKIFGATTKLIDHADKLNDVDALVLPGVGAFGEAMKELKTRQLDTEIKSWVKQGKPLLGVCLGLQLLFEESEEMGTHKGLNIISGKVIKFPARFNGATLKVPHMGWVPVHFSKPDHLSLKGIKSSEDMYFVHSYYVETSDEKTILTWSEYQGLKFVSSISTENIWAFQFHPEKSGNSGLAIYKNWLNSFGEKV